MNFWKRMLKAVLYPHIVIMILLIPVSVVALICSMVSWGTDSIASYVAYCISAYTLTVVCFRIPNIIRFVKRLKTENRLVSRISNDAHLRVKLSLYGSFYFNTVYSLFQLGLGFFYDSIWFFAMSAYYFLLALMRMYLLGFTRVHAPGELMEREYKRYRFCGIVMLILTATLSVIVTYSVLSEPQTKHGMIVTIAMAAFTFTALSVAIVNVIKYRRYKSPVFAAAKCISLTVAVVSMLTLENTMLSTFSDGTMDADASLLMTALSGMGVMIFVLAMAIYMIVRSTGELKRLRGNNE
ncbi:MAG: hypothetical protein IJY39_11420 [Clostridia bacterium]|nr:hypothetical protein [Clostridia bacterium]